MKVCGQEIFAHSNVLAAASPYLSSFLSQDLPRQFSQRSPQVIEIQIDGSEPNFLYVEAVSAVVDFIYTGKIVMKQSSVSQVYEIGRIMQMDSIVKYCTEFLDDKPKLTDNLDEAEKTDELHHSGQGKRDCATLTDPWDAGIKLDEILGKNASSQNYRSRITSKFGDPAFHAKIKAKQLVSVSCQIYPHLLPEVAKDNANMQDQATSTDSRYFETLRSISHSSHKLRKRKARGGHCIYQFINTGSGNVMTASNIDDADEQEALDVSRDDEVEKSCDVTETVEAQGQHCVSDDMSSKQSPCASDTLVSGSETSVGTVHSENSKTATCDAVSKISPRRSSRRFKPTTRFQEFHELQELQLKRVKDITSAANENVDNVLVIAPLQASVAESENKEENDVENYKEERMEQEEAAVRLLSLADEIVQKQNSQDTGDDEELDRQEDNVSEHMVTKIKQRRCFQRRTTRKPGGNLIHIGPGKYQCETCSFHTNKVRQMSAHIKLHKLENNTCYYCEQKFESKEALTDHMGEHKGPVPFFCHICGMRFKSRTLLNMHLPKHSDSKPFICDVCSMGFKWKHALKSHMITHTNKKEHLCDICGYATAHKSQLKAHHKIHSGDMLRCYYPNCNFLATKSQNLKYHLLTHTKEKPHQCDTCGQNFSLVKNLRRHLLLHSAEKKLSCVHCMFSSTRLDKLKEHMLKIHGIGTPPERRIRVTDLVYGQGSASLQGTKDRHDADEKEGLVKVELLEQMEAPPGDNMKEVTISPMAQFTQELSEQGDTGEGTLIEIIQENGQPMQILRNESILITHPADQEGTRILHHVEGTVRDMTDIVHITSTSDQTLVLSEPVNSVVTTIGQDTGSMELMTSHDVVAMESSAEGLVSTQIVTAVPGYLQIQGLDPEQVTYAEMVEVPVEQVSGLVQQVDEVQME